MCVIRLVLLPLESQAYVLLMYCILHRLAHMCMHVEDATGLYWAARSAYS